MKNTSLIKQLEESSIIASEHNDAIQPTSFDVDTDAEVEFNKFRHLTLDELNNGLRSLYERRSDIDKITFTFHHGFKYSDDSLLIDIYRTGDVSLDMSLDNTRPYYFSEISALVNREFSSIGGEVVSGYKAEEESWYMIVNLRDHNVSLDEVSQYRGRARKSARDPGDGRDDSIESVLRKLRRGLFQDLVGQVETSRVEFKSDIDLSSEGAKLELARDIARFANSDQSAVIVVGYRTKRSNGQDATYKVTPVQRVAHTAQRYNDIIDQRVYPPVRGISVETFTVDDDHDRAIVAITIPAQRESDKPFLVHGAIIGDKVEGSYISIVRRRGEGSIPVTAREIHALLSAGYKVMRESQ